MSELPLFTFSSPIVSNHQHWIFYFSLHRCSLESMEKCHFFNTESHLECYLVNNDPKVTKIVLIDAHFSPHEKLVNGPLSQLVQASIRQAQKSGKKNITLEDQMKEPKVLRFYQKEGFRCTGKGSLFSLSL